jgi:hypothetical protein
LKQAYALSQLLFNFALEEYSNKRIQVNHKDLKLNVTLQHKVNADDVNATGGSITSNIWEQP